MKQLLWIAIILALLGTTVPWARAQAPANNLFANAIAINGPIATVTGSNVGANKEFFEPNHGGNRGGASVWWTWTAPASGQTTIDTSGSSFNTLLGVYVGNAVNTLTTIAGNDDYSGNTWSRVQFNATAGIVYHIAVDGFRAGGFGGQPATGTIKLNVQGPGGVTISSPTNGAVFTIGDPIPLAVDISTNFPNPPAIRVDFYRAGVLFGSSTTAPFTAIATNVPAGTNIFYAIAYDGTNQAYPSPAVSVFVQNIGLTLLSPVEDTVFFNTNPITVSAWAYLPSGTMTNIDFYVDGQKFGQDSSAPFSATWSNVFGGSHRFTAIGHSDTGGTYNSQPANVGVVSLLVHSNSVWKYLDDGSDQGTNWIVPGFDDSSWASGPAELGYGDGDEATVVHSGPTNNYYVTTYFRRAFEATNVSSISSLLVLLAYDDAAAVYLNGTEIYRTANLPTNQTYTTFATGAAIEETVDVAVRSAAALVEGTNVLAIEIHQQALTSSDISFYLQLSAIPQIIHNLSPLAMLTAPTNNAEFLAPPSVTLQATASDPDGSVAKVEFYVDGVKVGEATNEPYATEWALPAVGPHWLEAVAVDNLGARGESAAVFTIIYDAAGTPYAQITSPPDGFAVEGGTNLLLTAFASAQHGVTSVQFRSNGASIGDDFTVPFSLVWDAPFGTNFLTAIAFDSNGVRGTSAVVRLIAYPNTNAPTIVAKTPAPNLTLSNFTSLSVTFSERVHHVDASDLLVSGIPATGVTGSGANYVFTFPQPPYGEVEIAWANGHGITDFGYPSDLPFNELNPDAQWEYILIDNTAPTIASRTPASGATVTNLSQISVTFSENVTNVDATDLLVNGTAAVGLAGSGSNYLFSVMQPGAGTVNITWVTNHGITDLAEVPNAFNRASGGWSFTLDTRVTLIQSNSNWRFVKGFTEASTPASAWRQPEFDDSSWSNSQAPFFFGDPYTNFNAGIYGTLLSDMQSNYTTIFLRHEFVVQSRGSITSVLINHQSDDGFIAWLNGVEVLRYNVPSGDLAYNATASTAANEPNNSGAAYIVATLTNSAVSRLVNGTNVLAIQAFNQNLTNSSDFGFNAQLYYFPVDATTVAPRLVSADPVSGELFYLTNITVNFSEGVSGVDAEDLLINGIPATGVSSTTNATYTFSFTQPAYGPVLVTWSTNHGISDFDSPPKAFDGAVSSSILSYTLLNPSSPKIVSQIPLAGTTVTGLTSIAITFTELVTGVDASDLLVSGTPATNVTSADNTTYSFSFPQPAFGTITIRWATNHGITDVEVPPALFDPTRFGGQWNYTLIDPVPSVSLTSPTNNGFVLEPADIPLRATATDRDGTIAKVEFFQSGNKLGESTNAPYSLTWSNVLRGTYSFTALATDNSGLSRTSAPVVLNVVTSLPIFLVRGPYLQIGSSTGGVVRWRSDLRSDAVVYYGTDPTNLANYSVQTMVTNEHIVTIAGLQPDTKYFYSIGSSSQRLAGTNGVDSAYWFKTAPPPGIAKPVRFWVLGDSGTANENARNVRNAYYAYAATNGPADIWLMLGDNAYNSGLDTEFQNAVFDMYPDTLRNLFLWPTIGNHESDQSFTSESYPYLDIFSLPHNGEAGGVPSGTQKYYSFDYAHVHFICLDSMTSGRATNTAMAQWLVNDLTATTQKWVIAFFHHPAYTRGNHNSDNETELIEIRSNILPLLESHGVDLVLCGHSHAIERSYLLNGHYGLSGTLTPAMKIDPGDGRADGSGAYHKNALGQGTVYSVSGSSGQITGGSLNHPANFVSLNELASLVIDVNGNRLDVKALGTNGNYFDHYTISKDPLAATPINLIARALDDHTAFLTWTDVATNELGFTLERSSDQMNFFPILTNAPDTTSVLDPGLLANTTYFYRIRAFTAGGGSTPSSVASVTTIRALAVPQAPSGLVANSGNTQIILHWVDNSTNEAGFLVERSSDAGVSFLPMVTVGANVAYYVDRNLAVGGAYVYRVRSFNSMGDSLPSNLSSSQTYPQDTVVMVGGTAIFHAGVDGTPPLGYQWRFLDAPIPGATNEALTITNAARTDEGVYTVVVTDAVGSRVSNPAWLFVLAPPAIVEHPASRTNVVGSVTTFHLLADGATPFIYQWRKDGAALPGANSQDLTIASVTPGDQADYDVVVANSLGAVTSQVARLVANFAPVAGVDSFEIFKNQSLNLTSSILLTNDTDPDGDALALMNVSSNSLQGGTISVVDQSIVYFPRTNYAGDDSFTYLLGDARGASSVGVVSIYVSGNTAPLLAAVPDLFASVLTPLVFTNLATDSDLPENSLTYSLAPGAPLNSRIKATNGVFRWTPARNQAPSTNSVTVWVTDDGRPSLSNSVSFTVYVNDYIEVTAGYVAMSAGDTTNVPIDTFSSAALHDLQCSVQFPSARLSNVSLEQLAPELATVSLQMADSNTASLTFTAPQGLSIQGTQHLARLHFTAVTNQTSAFIPLRVSFLNATRSSPGIAPTVLVNNGRATVVAAEPLMEALPSTPPQRLVTLYGKKGTRYNLEYFTNALTNWQLKGPLPTLTNISQTVSLPTSPAPPVFYRLRQ